MREGVWEESRKGEGEEKRGRKKREGEVEERGKEGKTQRMKMDG